MKTFVQCLCLTLPLVACGGSGTSGKVNPSPPPQVQTDYSTLKDSKLEPGPLKNASATDIAALVKNGLRISLRENRNFNEQVRTATLSGNKATTNDAQAVGNFSGTNVQVENVDEADVIKYDGHYIYAATPVVVDDAGAKAGLKIFETDPANATSKEINNILLDTAYWGDVSELYLLSDAAVTSALVTVRRSMNFMYFAKDGITAAATKNAQTIAAVEDDSKRLIMPQQMERGIEIALYDIRAPSSLSSTVLSNNTAFSNTALSKTWTITLDGDLLASRKIGNKLYVVSSYVPGITDLLYAAKTKDELVANETLIEKTPLDKLLPNYTINGGARQPLNKESCLIPANTQAVNGYLNLINITTIDLATQKVLNSVCVNSNVEGVYSSVDSLYLGGSDPGKWESWSSYSVIHKFNYTAAGVSYEGTGSIEGILGWGQPSYRMDEHNNALRVVTTRYSDRGEPIHLLSILQKAQGRSELEVVAQLPNKTHPEAIGKPKEEIYAVRFNGDRAFVVTFERKDPLYVLNLADVKNPEIAGQLEIPGFSTYLRPIGNDFIFSLGNETGADGRLSGVKLALFDIRDLTNPTLVSKHIFGGAMSWSEALYEPHALTFLNHGPDQIRVSLPIVLYNNEVVENSVQYRWVNTALHLFEINGLSAHKASLDYAGSLTAETSDNADYPSWSGYDRSVLHDNAVYYIHDSRVLGSFWPQAKP